MNSPPPASTVFDSTIDSVDRAEDLTRRYAESVGFSEHDQYFIGLALREIFVNAIKHGNRFDSEKRVVLKLSTDNGDSIIIEVIDQGQGFQASEVPDPLADENLERRSGRGLTMAVRIMDEFTVEKHRPDGTHVRMLKRLPSA
jgi:serine/threonine-protein kinase RsbW